MKCIYCFKEKPEECFSKIKNLKEYLDEVGYNPDDYLFKSRKGSGPIGREQA